MPVSFVRYADFKIKIIVFPSPEVSGLGYFHSVRYADETGAGPAPAI